MVGGHQVEAQSCSLETDQQDIDSGLLLKVCYGSLTMAHCHGTIHAPVHEPECRTTHVVEAAGVLQDLAWSVQQAALCIGPELDQQNSGG